MKANIVFSMLALSGLVLTTGCNNDDDEDQMVDTTPTTGTISMNVSGLEDVGSDYVYEGWIIVDGSPVTTGTFTVDESGTPSTTSFTVGLSDLNAATAFVVSIEPVPDNDPAPSDVKILGGDFSGDEASLSVGHGAALGDDLSGAAGTYILATPTDNDMMNELSGVWWLDPSAGPGASLTLPTLPAGWAYEGWAVVGGTPVSTGTFTDPAMADDAAPYSGTDNAGPPFPGEDMLMNAPDGVTFPLDLSGETVVISIEPVPDNSPAPFTLKPLVGTVPAGAATFVSYNMDNNASATNPTGTVAR